MTFHSSTPDKTTAESSSPEVPVEADEADAELLVEEVSIDGMCGVY